MLPSECLPEHNCTCYLPEHIKGIANGLRERETCQVELSMARKFIDESKDRHSPAIMWWQEPGVVGGGVVLGFALGIALTLAVKR